MSPETIYYFLKICNAFNLNFYLKFTHNDDNDDDEILFTPTVDFKFDKDSKILPSYITIYDKGWDEIDYISFNKIKQCIPVLQSFY